MNEQKSNKYDPLDVVKNKPNSNEYDPLAAVKKEPKKGTFSLKYDPLET